MSKKKLFGTTTAVVTPFTETGEVNESQLRNLVNFLIESGVNCLYPLGTTGEMFKMSIDERKRVAEVVIKETDGRIPVFIHCGSKNSEETIELAVHAHSLGADGIGIITPVFFKLEDYELLNYYEEVLDNLPQDLQVYLYSIPQLSANELTFELVSEIANKYQNVIGIKYSFNDFQQLKKYLSIKNGDFSVVTGADSLMLPALALGCDGVISGISCVYPEPFVQIYKNYLNGDLEKSRKHQVFADQIIDILKAGSNMSYFKEALKLRNVDVGTVRKPNMRISESTLSSLSEDLKQWELLYKGYLATEEK